MGGRLHCTGEYKAIVLLLSVWDVLTRYMSKLHTELVHLLPKIPEFPKVSLYLILHYDS